MNNKPALSPFSHPASFSTRAAWVALWVLGRAACGLAALGTGAALAQAAGPLRATELPAAAAPSLGTLLLSPGQRKNLEATRSAGGSTDQAAPAALLALPSDRLREAAPGLPDTLIISGVVIRSGQRSTVWVNDQPLYGRGVEEPLRALAGKTGMLEPGSKELLLKARPGQVIDLPSGQSLDLLPPGAIRIIPPQAGASATTPKE